MQDSSTYSRKEAANRPRWWAHITQATRIRREREPIGGLRLAMTVCSDEDLSAVQYRVSDLMHAAIALAGGPATAPDWTLVDGEGPMHEDDAPGWTAFHMPIPDDEAFDDERLAHAVAIAGALAAMDDKTGQTVRGPTSGLTGDAIAVAREIPGYGSFAVRARRREWEAVLASATGWTPFEGNDRLIERILLVHSRRRIVGRIEGSGYRLSGTDPAIALLRSERPRRENDLAWLLAPDDGRTPSRKSIDEILGRLAYIAGAADYGP